MQTWLNPNIEDEEQFKEEVSQIFKVYEEIETLTEAGVCVYTVDEKMGISAREHVHETQAMKPGVATLNIDDKVWSPP